MACERSIIVRQRQSCVWHTQGSRTCTVPVRIASEIWIALLMSCVNTQPCSAKRLALQWSTASWGSLIRIMGSTGPNCSSHASFILRVTWSMRSGWMRLPLRCHVPSSVAPDSCASARPHNAQALPVARPSSGPQCTSSSTSCAC